MPLRLGVLASGRGSTLQALIDAADERTFSAISPLIELGLNHEEQHQELLLTALKHAFGLNPLRPRSAPPASAPPGR